MHFKIAPISHYINKLPNFYVTSQKVRVKIKKLVDKLNLRCYEHNV